MSIDFGFSSRTGEAPFIRSEGGEGIEKKERETHLPNTLHPIIERKLPGNHLPTLLHRRRQCPSTVQDITLDGPRDDVHNHVPHLLEPLADLLPQVLQLLAQLLEEARLALEQGRQGLVVGGAEGAAREVLDVGFGDVLAEGAVVEGVLGGIVGVGGGVDGKEVLVFGVVVQDLPGEDLGGGVEEGGVPLREGGGAADEVVDGRFLGGGGQDAGGGRGEEEEGGGKGELHVCGSVEGCLESGGAWKAGLCLRGERIRSLLTRMMRRIYLHLGNLFSFI